MMIYVDIDGTLTTSQNKRRGQPWPEMLDRVRELIAAGHSVVLWSGSSRYARAFAKRHHIDAVACLAKPNMLVDNQVRKWGNRLKNRTISPEQFLREVKP